MKTIEERASEYSKGRWDELTAKEAYIAGATEQQAIEEEVTLKKYDAMTGKQLEREEHFTSWYFQNVKGVPTFSDAIEWARRQTIDEACEWLSNNIIVGSEGKLDTFLRELHKAMDK